MSKAFNKKLNEIVSDYKKDSNETKVLSELKKLIMSHKSERYITVLYSKAKKEFKKHSKDQTFLKKISPPTELTQRVLSENVTRRDNQTMMQVDRDMLVEIAKFKSGRNSTQLAIWIMMVSGRRVSEVANGKFVVKKGSKNIFFKGMLKKRTDVQGEHELFLLTSKTTFRKVYQKFKQMMKGRSSATLNDTVNKKLKSMFGPEMRSHKLRGIYANYIIKFHNPENLKPNTVIMNALGHSTTTTSLSYTGFELNFDKPVKF